MSTKPSTPRIEDDKSILEVVKKNFAAWESLNTARARNYYRKAPQDTFFHLYSTRLENWSEYKNRVQKYLDHCSQYTINVDDTRLFREGNLAWVAISCHLEETFKDGKKTSREARYTGVLLPTAGSWQIVHEQWSVPVRAAGWENY